MLNWFWVLYETLQSLILCNVLCKLSLGWLVPVPGELEAIATQAVNIFRFGLLNMLGVGAFLLSEIITEISNSKH